MSNTITPTVFYRTLNVEGLEIFYREACGWRIPQAPRILEVLGPLAIIRDSPARGILASRGQVCLGSYFS